MGNPLDYGGTEEAEEVATARELESRDEFLCHGCATNNMAALEHSHREASTSEVSGCYQTVVAGADDQRVPFLLLETARCSRTAVDAS